MKNQSNNLTASEEAKIALQELAGITLDKYVEEAQVKSKKQKLCKEKMNTKKE